MTPRFMTLALVTFGGLAVQVWLAAEIGSVVAELMEPIETLLEVLR